MNVAAGPDVLPADLTAVKAPALLFIPETAAIWAVTARITIATPDIASAVTICHTQFVTLTRNRAVVWEADVTL